MKFRSIFLPLLFLLPLTAAGKDILWYDGHNPVSYNLISKHTPTVDTALEMFEEDMKRVTGKTPISSGKSVIEIYQLDQLRDKDFSRLQRRHLPVSDIIAHPEAYAIVTLKGKIMLLGSDSRGTAYAILRLSSLAGVSAWDWWGDLTPLRRKTLSMDETYREIDFPSITWRGLRLNDPQGCLPKWSKLTLDHEVADGETGPHAWQQLFRLMLRLRLNCLELATEKEAEAYYSHRKNLSMANDCGILVWTDSHNLKHIRHGARQDQGLTLEQFVRGKDRWDIQLSHHGAPADWAWLPTAAPGLLANELRTAWNDRVRLLWMAEIHEPKLPAAQIALFSAAAWNPQNCLNQSPTQLLAQFFQQHFGKDAARKIMPLLADYYRLTAIRKPEYMRWPLQESRQGTAASAHPFSLFSPEEFDNELGRYLVAWQTLAERVQQVSKSLPAAQQDAYFSWVEYPVLAAMQMAVKELEAQESRQIYRKGTFHHDEEALEAAANATMAYRQLHQLTQRFDKQVGKGRWHGLVQTDEKRCLFFAMPPLPDALSEAEIKQYHQPLAAPSLMKSDEIVARNAAQYDEAEGQNAVLEMTGHSGKAILLEPGSSLTFEFSTARQGTANLFLAFVPLPRSATATLRFAVSVDGGKAQDCTVHLDRQSHQGSVAAVRGQAVHSLRHFFDRGSHTLTVTALDGPAVLDQWMADFDLNRKFYTFPTVNKH